MMKKCKVSKKLLLTAGLCGIICAVKVPDAMAYFTTYVVAKGGYPITLGNEIEIKENVENMTKHIVLENTGNADCYVRTKVFSGTQYEINFSADSNWSQGQDGYWYYNSILAPGEKTGELLAQIKVPQENSDSFNVIVIQENTAVLYHEDGQAYADWNQVAHSITNVGTATGEEAGE